MFNWIIPSLGVLAILGISYLIRPKELPARISFTLWCVAVQFFIIGLTGVAVIHTHLGCQFLLGDCYVEGYPGWLALIQRLLVLYVWGLWAGAAVQAVSNLIQILVLKERKENEAKLNNKNQSHV